MVLGGVVDSADAIWCEGLDVRHSVGAIEKRPVREAITVGITGMREVRPIPHHLRGQVALRRSRRRLELVIVEQVGHVSSVEGSGGKSSGNGRYIGDCRSVNS